MLPLAEIARLEERRQALGIGEVAPESRPFGRPGSLPANHQRPDGGVLSRGLPGQWCNSAVGLGLDGPVAREDLEDMAAWYASAGIEPRVELCPFAHPSLIEHLGAMGFVVKFFEMVFFRELSDLQGPTESAALGQTRSAAKAPFLPPTGVEIRLVDPADDEMVRTYARVAISGFFPEGVSPTEADYVIAERVPRHSRTRGVVAIADARVVGAGAVEVMGDASALFGVTVLPEYRQRGIQTAMLEFRMRHAAERGAKIATIGSLPGGGTERNVRRMGFQVAYTRPALVRPGPGLVSVPVV